MRALSAFFSSYAGMYVLQSVLHSVITLFIVERALYIWDVRSPEVRFRYRLSVMAFPVFMYPLFQFINPERGSFYFRTDSAVFDGGRWLSLEIWGGVPISLIFFALMLASTALVFFFQELIPVIRHSVSRVEVGDAPESASPEVLNAVEELARDMGVRQPEVLVMDDEHPVIYTAGAKRPSITLSGGALKLLDTAQMRSALAHEMAHIIRRTNLTSFLAFILRIIMFYNPVSLIVFRRLIQDDELVCDDITVSVTKDPVSLAETLKVFYATVPSGACGLSAMKESIEGRSHNMLLEERVRRLEEEDFSEDEAPGWGRYFMTMAAVLAVNYLVV